MTNINNENRRYLWNTVKSCLLLPRNVWNIMIFENIDMKLDDMNWEGALFLYIQIFYKIKFEMYMPF